MYVCHQFLSISYWSNNEYWSQKHTQSGNIHSTELDVYAEKQSAANLSFILSQHKQGRNFLNSIVLLMLILGQRPLKDWMVNFEQ